MSIFVLVHGSWGGGWQWRRLANLLRSQGHEAYPVTLRGLGDRSHLGLDQTSLTVSAHIEDVVQLLYFEDLHDVVLVGWSYGGAVVDGVADRVPERLATVVNLDGEIVVDGRSLQDGWTPEQREETREFHAGARKSGWLRPPTADQLADVLDDPELRAWLGQRLRPQPYATYTEPYPDTGGRRHTVPHVYLRCTEDYLPEDPAITRLRSDVGWRVHDLPLNHLGLLYAPEVVAEALIEVAGNR